MKNFLLLFLFGLSLSAISQSLVVSGKVTDASGNKPLQYVNIYIKGTNVGTVTNIEGRFSLVVPAKYRKSKLVFSYMGYHEVEKQLKNIKSPLRIKLKPYIQNLSKVTVKAKPPDPREIFKTAVEKIKENVYQDRYKVKIFARNFVQKDSVFVQYRKTLLTSYPKGDNIWWSEGEILADKYLTLNKNIFSLLNNERVVSGDLIFPDTDYERYFGRNYIKILNKRIIKIDTVIFSKNQKIYVIDSYNSTINPKVLPLIYKLLEKYPSPYSVIFDKKAQELIIKIFKENNMKYLWFTKHYIDAKQNYNIIKSISFSIGVGIDLITMIKDYTAYYTVATYTNTKGKSILEHSMSFRKLLYNNDDMYKYYGFSSLFEQFCYQPEFRVVDTTIQEKNNLDSTLFNKYYFAIKGGFLSNSFDNWKDTMQFVKTDSLEQKAIDQIQYPYKYYDLDEVIAQLDSANNISFKKIKKEKPKYEVPIHLAGKVIDSVSYYPIPYANLILKNLDDTTKKIIGAISDDNGKYSLDIPLGYKYLFEISHIGYKTFSDTLDLFLNNEELKELKNTPINLKLEALDIELIPQKSQLQTVTVKGKTKSLDIDKQTVIVTKKMRENTIAAKDLLDKVDGVKFNKITEEVKVDGSKKVKLLVDGVEKDPDYILNLNPKRIKQIEVLRNISGLYAAEGYKYIVNIITYDNYRGFDLSIEDQYLDKVFWENTAYLKQNDADISLNITRDKWNYFIKTYSRKSENSILTRNITAFATGDTIVNGSDGNPNNFDKSKNYGVKLGADYKISRKHLVGVEIGVKGFPAYNNSISTSYDTIISGGSHITTKNITTGNSEYNELFGNLYYNFNINPTAKLVSYIYLTNRQTFTNQDINGDKPLNYQKTNNNLNYKLELDKTFKHKYTIIAGGRYLANDYHSVALDSGQADFSNSFSKLTGFSYLRIKFNKKTGLQFGSIYEIYNSKNNDTAITFNSFQPKLNFYKTFKNNHKLVLEYSIKTRYPYLSDLNPQLNYITPFVASVGNPRLKPYLYHNFSLEYSKMTDGFLSYFSIKPYYNFSDNELGISPLTQDSLIVYRNENFVKHETYGVSTYISLEVNKKWNLDFDFDLFKDWNKNLSTPQIIDWYGNAEITYQLDTKHYFALMYQKDLVRNVTSLGYSLNGTDFLMIYWMTLQMKGRLQLMVGYVFPSFYSQVNDDYENTPYYTKHSYSDISLFNNMIMINLVFRLSKGKVEREKKNIDYEDFEEDKSRGKLNFNINK